MSKYVYVVKGSEDGNLGVFSAKKRAMDAALEYYCNGNDVDPGDADINIYGDGSLICVGCGWASAEIERFLLS